VPKITKRKVIKKTPTTKKTLPKRKRTTKGGIADRIRPISFEGRKLKINLYGRSATGKTTLWGSFPKPILAIICSGTEDPGELLSLNTPVMREGIDQVVLEKSSEIPEIIEVVESGGEYATVVLDHATDLQNMVLKEVLGIEKVPEQLSWGLATQQQYGQIALQMKERLRSVLELPTHVVIVAQEREFNTTEESGSVVMPYVASALSPSVVGWLNPACDYICETFMRPETKMQSSNIGGKRVDREVPTGRIEYCLRTAPDAVYTTKFRLPKGQPVPDVIVDPTYNKILDVVNQP